MIRLVFPPGPEEDVSLAASPLLEAALSLHVLLDPGHHALQHAWVRRARALDPALRREIEAVGFAFRRQIPDVFTPLAAGAPQGIEAELAHLRATAPELLLDAFARPVHDHGGDVARLDLDAVRAVSPELAADPSAFADRVCRTIERYWEAGFADEWERIEPLLARAIADGGRALASLGIGAVLGRLPRRCRFDAATGELTIAIPHEHRVEVSAARPIVLVASAFVWPHLRVSCDEPWPLALVYTAPAIREEAEPRLPPAELLGVLRVLGDDTRLRLLRLIAERPRTTQELQPIVGLSRAGLSKGLRRLAEAGLVAPRREGYYVVYHLVPERLDAVGPALGRFLVDAPARVDL